jgi:hypothetical protein
MSDSRGAVHFILYLFMDAFSSSVVEVVNAYKTLVRKPKGRQIGRPWCRRQSNIKIDLKEISKRVWTGHLRVGTGGVLS